jgi:hypothetical protein
MEELRASIERVRRRNTGLIAGVICNVYNAAHVNDNVMTGRPLPITKVRLRTYHFCFIA